MSDATRRAKALIGTPFRLQGRDPGIALDCVGLVLCAFELPHDTVSRCYGRQRHDLHLVDVGFAKHFRRVSPKASQTGDVLVLRCGPNKLHLGVASEGGLIHADAVLGRTVCRPWPTEWPIARVYRRRKRRK